MVLSSLRNYIFLSITLFMVQSDDFNTGSEITIFLSGDVMTGRGIDQVLPYSNPPQLYESYVKDARHYVKLAEKVNGPIPKPVPLDYVWGIALKEFDKKAPDIRLINLETSVTTSGDPWRDKGVHYRMHPGNAGIIRAGGINAVTLANNHTLDWGYTGLEETLGTLENAGIPYAGAGRNTREASTPVTLKVGGKRILILGAGMTGSGIPKAWQAKDHKPGLFLLEDYSKKSLLKIKKAIEQMARPDDLVIISIHWGGNWGYEVTQVQRDFAHSLVDDVGADLVHGHSSHHFKGMEVYKGKLILYGCGDLISDYEGISGHESYRSDLGLLYFATITRDGDLKALEMVPTQMRRFQLVRPSKSDVDWIHQVLNREGEGVGLTFLKTDANTLRLAQ